VLQRARCGYGVFRSAPEKRPLLAGVSRLCAGQGTDLGPDTPRPAAPNKALHLTAYGVRSAPASGSR
jgi:hypothetical protein